MASWPDRATPGRRREPTITSRRDGIVEAGRQRRISPAASLVVVIVVVIIVVIGLTGGVVMTLVVP